MTFIDLFAGIGGFRLGMEMAGHECLGWCEIDKHARKSYTAMHNPKESEWFAEDITMVTDESIRLLGEQKRIDIICAGFPCQPFSIAGKHRGFEDTRGTLFFEIARFAKILRPKYLFLENVKGLLNHQRGETFATILGTLDELGYDAEWQVLNSKDFGVPQNRERVFIIGHLRGQYTRKVFPIAGGNSQTLKQLIGGQQGMRVYDPEGLSCTISSQGGGWGAKTGLYLIDEDNRKQVIDSDNNAERLEIRPCLTPDRENKRQNGRRFKNPGEPMFTLTSQDRHGVMIKTAIENDVSNIRIRRLTPRECFRLQGFPDWAFEKAASVCSDAQLYKQAGNAVTVPVIYEIAKRF